MNHMLQIVDEYIKPKTYYLFNQMTLFLLSNTNEIDSERDRHKEVNFQDAP